MTGRSGEGASDGADALGTRVLVREGRIPYTLDTMNMKLGESYLWVVV